MEPEKVIVQPPPPYKDSKVKATPLIAAVGVACVCGTALFVVSVLGGIYINQLKGQISKGSADMEPQQKGGNFKTSINITIKMDDEDKSVKETVNLDKVRNEEVDLQYDEHGELEFVSVMDYATNIYGSYSVADQECYIYQAGIHKYDSVEELMDKVYNDDVQRDVHYNSTRMDYQIDGKAITDHSILPDNLKPYCENKDTYWLKPMDHCAAEQEHGREKRATYYCIGGRWVYRGRCCGCSCPLAPYCGCWKLNVCVGGYIRRG